MHVVTTYFKVRRVAGSVFIGDDTFRDKEVRAMEYQSCIFRNLASPAVSNVHLIVQDDESMEDLLQSVVPRISSPFQRLKLKTSLYTKAPEQPLYGDLFEYANTVLHNKTVMVCNADIYLGKTFPIKAVEKQLSTPSKDSKQQVFALSRYENEATMFAPLIDDYRGSHDAFAFKSPIPPNFVAGVQHRQNCYKSENIVIHELRKAGLAVTNPCKDAHIFHLHEADLRQWMPSVDEDRYGRAWPCHLDANDTGN